MWLFIIIALLMGMLFGQMLLSLFMEKYGWMGAPEKRITVIEVAGIILMLAGVVLIRL